MAPVGRSGAVHGTRALSRNGSPDGGIRPVTGPALGTGRWERHVESGPTGRRGYAVYTPRGLPPGRPVPLVVVLHGCRQSAEDAAAGTGVNVLADRAGFVALYPEQRRSDNVRRCWNWFDPRHQSRGAGEPADIAQVTERVLSGAGGAGVRLDRDRVHAMGLSAGGAMAGILAATYPDLYASVGIHSAPQYGAARSTATALLAMRTAGPQPERQGAVAHAAMGPRARVVPVVVFQGDADRTVRPRNGSSVVRQWLTTARLAADGASASGAAARLDSAGPPSVRTGRTTAGLSYRVRTWADAAGQPVVEYWLVSGLGHAWSGGTPAGSFTDPRGPSATEAMYAFFQASPRNRQGVARGAGQPTARSAVGRGVRRLQRWLRPHG